MLGMANINAMGISPEAQLLATQIPTAGGGFGPSGLVLGGIAGFAGLQWYGAVSLPAPTARADHLPHLREWQRERKTKKISTRY